MSDISAAGAAAAQPTATLPSSYTAPAPGSSSTTASLNGVNANTFLQLLVSQLQNQDPDNPTDPTQFLSETADFEEVQQLNALQTSVASMVSAQQQGAATSLLGSQVTGSDQAGSAVTGVVSGIQLTSSGPMLTVGSSTVPYSSVTAVTSPGASTPGTSTPGPSTPGTSTPGTSTPGTATPGAATPGTATPGTSTPGTSTPGTSTPGTSTPGASIGTSAATSTGTSPTGTSPTGASIGTSPTGASAGTSFTGTSGATS